MSALSNRLPALAGEIETAHQRCRAGLQEALEAALAAGRALLEAKELVPHGQWQAWLYANLPGISVRTAQRYMLAAERSGKNDTVSFSSLRELTRPAGEFNLTTLPMRVLVAVGMDAFERIKAAWAEGEAANTSEEAIAAYRRCIEAAREGERVCLEITARAEHGMALCQSVPEGVEAWVQTLEHGPPWGRLVDAAGKPL